jgi:hypothetical protein
MKFFLYKLTNHGSHEPFRIAGRHALKSGVLILKFTSAIIFVCSTLVACSGYSINAAANAASENSENSELVNAANAEIAESNASGAQDTQCSDFVAKVIRRTGLNVPAFHANDFDKVAATFIPNWTLTEFTTDDLNAGRAALRDFLDSTPDHTTFLAQWPRTNQSGHVAIVEKVAKDQFVIYQAQAGLSLPHSAPVKIESLLYGARPIERSHIRLWTE